MMLSSFFQHILLMRSSQHILVLREQALLTYEIVQQHTPFGTFC